MRIAILSDVHGNRFALEAVLKDIEAAKPDVLANLGDQVWGAADPAGAWALQQELDAVRVRGNTDEMVSSHFDELDERSHAYGSWLRSVLPYDATDTLAALPLSADLADGEVVVAHGALRDTWEALLFDFGDEVTPKPEKALSDQAAHCPQAKVFVVGHTHRELIRSVGGVTFINSGPVSRPFDNTPAARWTLLEQRAGAWSVSFKRVAYDVDAAIAWAHNNSPYGEQERELIAAP